MVEEEKVYQYAHNWAIHVWYEADLEYSKHQSDEVLKEEVQEAWQTLMAIEKIGKEKGYKI